MKDIAFLDGELEEKKSYKNQKEKRHGKIEANKALRQRPNQQKPKTKKGRKIEEGCQ